MNLCGRGTSVASGGSFSLCKGCRFLTAAILVGNDREYCKLDTGTTVLSDNCGSVTLQPNYTNLHAVCICKWKVHPDACRQRYIALLSRNRDTRRVSNSLTVILRVCKAIEHFKQEIVSDLPKTRCRKVCLIQFICLC